MASKLAGNLIWNPHINRVSSLEYPQWFLFQMSAFLPDNIDMHWVSLWPLSSEINASIRLNTLSFPLSCICLHLSSFSPPSMINWHAVAHTHSYTSSANHIPPISYSFFMFSNHSCSLNLPLTLPEHYYVRPLSEVIISAAITLEEFVCLFSSVSWHLWLRVPNLWTIWLTQNLSDKEARFFFLFHNGWPRRPEISISGLS